MSSSVLVKNAKLWRWNNDPSSKIGTTHDCAWLVIEKGVITDICSASDARNHPPDGLFSNVIDVNYQLVVPGLNDAHM
jgi:imidazolonepropionase-like amidohydrolase